jgi:hypothetical protein
MATKSQRLVAVARTVLARLARERHHRQVLEGYAEAWRTVSAQLARMAKGSGKQR